MTHARASLFVARAEFRRRHGLPTTGEAREYASFYRTRRDAWRDALTTEQQAAADDADAAAMTELYPGLRPGVEV